MPFVGDMRYWVCPHCAAINTIKTEEIKSTDGSGLIRNCVTCEAESEITAGEVDHLV